MSATTTKAPRRLSEEERYRRLETRVLNRVKAWDSKTDEPRRYDVVEFLRDAIDELEVWAPDGRRPEDPQEWRRFGAARDAMYRYWTGRAPLRE